MIEELVPYKLSPVNNHGMDPSSDGQLCSGLGQQAVHKDTAVIKGKDIHEVRPMRAPALCLHTISWVQHTNLESKQTQGFLWAEEAEIRVQRREGT